MKRTDFAFIKANKKYIKLRFDDIALIKGLGNYVEILLTGGAQHIYYKSLKDLIDTLPESFMRVHNSYIVNLTNIETFEDNHLTVQGHKISVGKSFRECLKTAIDQMLL